MDKATADEHTAATLGRRIGLPGSPVVHLAGVANNAPAVLLIDQLDVVSTYSGRMPDAYDAVAEVLEQARSLPQLKVVLVVRTVDLHEDPRLRNVSDDEARVGTIVADLLGEAEVRQYLADTGIDVPSMTDSTVQLLRVPLHLAIFSRLSASSQRLAYRTLSDLYERFTWEVRREIEHEVSTLDWPGITGTLVQFMSERERLHAPAAILDFAAARQVAALHSHGVLLADEGRVEFFHETYFDFVFARAFVAAGRDLHDFLVESGQALFRRAQVRQVLEYLAAVDRDAFRSAVVRLLQSVEIRRHLQDVVVTVLRQLNAEPADWRALEPLAFGDGALAGQLASLLTTPAWFDAANTDERWPVLLSDPRTADRAADQLIIAARERPERVADLVRPYIGSSDKWRNRLRALIQWSMSPGLTGLAVELIARGEVDNVRGPIAVNSDFWSILYPLQKSDADAAARLIGAYVERARVRAAADGSGDPFASGHLDDYSSAGGNSTISTVAENAPTTFVREVLPFVISVVRATASAKDGKLAGSPRWRWRYAESRLSIDDAIFTGVEDALRRIADAQPGEAREIVDPLASTDFHELRFLACRTYAAAQPGNEAIEWLLADDRNLALGWADSPRWASRELIEAASGSCDDDSLHRLNERLLDYYPDRERSAEGRRSHGYAQYELLSTIPRARLCEAAAKRLAELERKFVGHPPEPPQSIEVKTVDSPIERPAAERLSDADWLRAIAKHRRDRLDWSGGVPIGGAAELANVVRERAEAEPDRFARLALQLDEASSPVYLCRIIEAVAGKIPVPDLGALCRHARAVAGQAVGRPICHAIGTAGGEATNVLVDLLKDCAGDDEPASEMARTRSEQGDFYFGGDLTMAGLNCTRGAAAHALARVLLPQLADQLMATLIRLALDPILAVRTAAADAVHVLMNTQREIALELAYGLFDGQPVDVFDARSTRVLLRGSLLRQPERFAPFLHQALDGPESVAEGAGSVWAAALVQDLLRPPLTTDLTALSTPARRGAAKSLAADPSVSPDLVVQLFDDEDESVRSAVAGAVRAINDLDPATAQLIVSACTASAAFAESFDDLFPLLCASTQILPDAAMTACERAVEVAGHDLGDIRTGHAAISDDLIKVVLRLYRQGDERMRERCLDVIDKLCEVSAYGLHDALAIER